jgi:hypothetical protein
VRLCLGFKGPQPRGGGVGGVGEDLHWASNQCVATWDKWHMRDIKCQAGRKVA